MNKKEFVKLVAEKLGKTQKEVEEVLGVILESIEETLVSGEGVKFTGFGNFEVSERAERKGRNPQTSEEMVIPASKAPKFKAGKSLKDRMNGR